MVAKALEQNNEVNESKRARGPQHEQLKIALFMWSITDAILMEKTKFLQEIE